MIILDCLRLLGGLSLFLFGISLSGAALERRAGPALQRRLSRVAAAPLGGFLTGLSVTALMQSSTAVTVMTVSFTGAGVLTLRQAIHIILGANVGTTVTPWLVSLSILDAQSPLLRLLSPAVLTPLSALAGIVLYLRRTPRRRDAGQLLLGFAIMMTGMQLMLDAAGVLGDLPFFCNLLLACSSPLTGLLAGALLTAVLQSSSASVGILQALAATGQLPLGAAIPIVLGQNIGTCLTALISSAAAGRSARRAALIHLCVNLFGSVLALALLAILKLFHPLPFLDAAAGAPSIAAAHTLFNLFCTAVFLPAAPLLERLVLYLVPEPSKPAVPGGPLGYG